MERPWRRNRAIWMSLAVVAALYVVAYAVDPYRPGARPKYPLGWYGWTDQSLYLRSTQAFAAGNLASAEHTYPVLYPLLGSAFLRVGLPDPFILINLAGLLVLAGVFLAVATAHLGQRWAVAVFWLSVLLMPAVYRQFIFPWTTILAAVLLSGLIWELHRCAGSPGRDTPLDCFRFTLIAFFLVPTRPLDAVASVPLCLLYGWRLLGTMHAAILARAWRWMLPRALGCVAGAVVGPVLHFGSNWLIHGSLQGRYGEQIAQSGGFQFSNWGEKVVSLLLDSGTLFGDPTASLLGHYPWGILVLIAFPLVLWLGDGLVRAVALTAALQFAMYAAFVDLLPGAVWKYHNIRYFSWSAPYVVLLVPLAAIGVRRNWFVPRARAVIVAATAAVLVLSAIRLRAVPVPVEVTVLNPTQFTVTQPVGAAAIDFLDVKGIAGIFTELYFGAPAIHAAGQDYRHVLHFRLIPTNFGARLVSFHPLSAPEIVVNLDPRTPLAPDASIRAFRATFGIGVPGWLVR